MRISFKLNREYDTELIKQLEKYKDRNLSQVIRKILRDNLVNKNSEVEVEDVFAEDKSAFNTDNVEIRKINRKTEINNNDNNKSKTIKWDIPK